MPDKRFIIWAGFVLVTGCVANEATVQLGNTVLCGPTAVIMPSQAVTSLRAMVGPEAYGAEVCRAVAGVNAVGLTQPTPVKVILPSGPTTVRVMQNLG